MLQIHFPNQEKTLEVPEETLLSEVIRRNFPDLLPMPCGGCGACGKCKVRLADEQVVLACQTKVEPGMKVFLQETESRNFEILTSFSSQLLINLKAEPGLTLAFDLGTTTLAACLLNGEKILRRTSRPNPQKAFGADVISRIQYALEDSEHRKVLQNILLRVIREMVQTLLTTINPESIRRLVFAGNTTMEESLLGLNLDSLAKFPFTPSSDLQLEYTASDSVWNSIFSFLNPQTEIRLLPVIGGFVGGDISAGISALKQSGLVSPPAFFLDLGTNGEMVLETETGRIACATAAGPCFEGAKISCGMCAEAGTITHIWNEAGAFRFEMLQDAPIRGICGSALIDLTAELLRLGLLTSDGRLLEPEEIASQVPESWRRRILHEKEEVVFQLTDTVTVTQEDFRELQLAVGAIKTGIQLLLRRGNTPLSGLKQFRIAGGFGKNLRLENAQKIGLIPKEIPLERVDFIGNASLAGAIRAAVSSESWEKMKATALETTCIDLSLENGFSDAFMGAMFWE